MQPLPAAIALALGPYSVAAAPRAGVHRYKLILRCWYRKSFYCA